MEPDIKQQDIQQEVEEKSTLHTVTPLSKYLAMALFIILPFVGGWIGYHYAPEKVVEVEKIVEIEKESVSDVVAINGSTETDTETLEVGTSTEALERGVHTGKDTSTWKSYVNEDYGFSFVIPPESRMHKITDEEAQGTWGRPIKEGREIFGLRDYNIDLHFVPTVFVDLNLDEIGIVELLEQNAYQYSFGINVGTIDGRPAFSICSGEGGGCSSYVVTDNYIFRFDNIGNIEFDDSIVGASEQDVLWPKEIVVPVIDY